MNISNRAKDAIVYKSVRISIIDTNVDNCPEDGINKGSGLLVASRKKFYVLTAYHCVKNNRKESIVVQWKDIHDNFHKLVVKDIFGKDEGLDRVILEVESPRNGQRYDNVKLEDSWIICQDPKFVFWGYPNIDKCNGHLFDIDYRGGNQWKVTEYLDFTVNSFGEQIEGCSGAGVMTEYNNVLYCAGVIKEIKGQNGTYQDVFLTPACAFVTALQSVGENFFAFPQDVANEHVILPEVKRYITRYCGLDKQTSGLYEIRDLATESSTLLDFVKGNVPSSTGYHYLLCGSPHSGKSYEMKHLAHLLSAEGFEVKQFRIKEQRDSFVEKFPSGDEENGRLIAILVDALDEAESSKYEQLANDITAYAKEHEDTVIVVSCRDGFVSEEQMKGFTRVYLQDLTDKQINDLINDEVSKPQQLFEQIRENRLTDEVRLPFFLRFIMDRYKKGEVLPSNNALLYNDWVHLSYLQQKEKYSTDFPDENVFLEYLNRMALVLQMTGKMQLPKENLKKIVGGEDLDILLKNGLFTEGPEYGFVHNSIKEFVIARYFRGRAFSEVKQRVCFKDKNEINPVWQNVVILWLQLICSEDGRLPDEVLSWILKADKTLLIFCDPRTICDEQRFEIFRSIMEDMRNRNQYISLFSNNYFSRLYRFAESTILEDYIFDQIKECKTPGPHLYNMMSMTLYIDWSKVESNSRERYESFCKELFDKLELFGKEENDSGSSYFLLNEHFYTDGNFVRKAYEILREGKSINTIGVLLSLICRSCMVDEFMDYVIESGTIIHTRETGNYLHQSTHYRALAGAKDIEAILKALQYVSSQSVTSAIHKQNEYHEMVKVLLEKAKKYKEGNEQQFIYDSIKACFISRFENQCIFVDDLIREELNAYKDTIELFGEWTDKLEGIYNTLYHQGVVSPEEEQSRKDRRQQDFDDFCNYETFYSKAKNLINRYSQGGGEDWTIYGIDIDGHYDMYLNRFFAENCGWRNLNIEQAQRCIEDKEYHDKYRLLICAEILYGHGEKREIKDDLDRALCFSAGEVLKSILSGERIDDRFKKAAIQFLIDGKVSLKDEDLIKLLPYSYESISGELPYMSIDDGQRSLLSLMDEQLGTEKLSQILRKNISIYDGEVTLQVYQWMRYLVAKDKKASKMTFLERLTEIKNTHLHDTMLDLMLENDVAVEDLIQQLDVMDDRDLFTCCNKLIHFDSYKVQVRSILENRFGTMNEFYHKHSVELLLKTGSMIALEYAADNAEKLMIDGDFLQFEYSEISALQKLSLIYQIVGKEYDIPAAMSILNSMGEIAAASEDNYEEVCAELDKISTLGAKFADVVKYKKIFKNRLLQRMEKQMTIEEAIKYIDS